MMDMLENDSDCGDYLDTSDSDDNDDIEFSYGNCAQRILSSLDESIGRIDDYLAFERGFAHGDFVTSVKDPAGQIGQIINVDVVIDLESSYGDVVKDVSSKALLKVRPFGEGDYVVCGPWLGQVIKVNDLVTVLLDNGAKCVIPTGDAKSLIPVSLSIFDDGPYIYYCGQRVKITYQTSLKSSRWFCGEWNNNQNEGTVCNVKVGSVVVKWIASVMVGCSIIAPPALQDIENLTLLSCFPHANWQIGDLCKLSPAYFQNLEINANVQAPYNSPLPTPTEWKKAGLNNQGQEQIYIISKTKTKVDVLWQDGSCSACLDLNDLTPVYAISEHDFWPGQVVQEKCSSMDTHISSCRRLGIVLSVSTQERTVKVKWMSSDLNHCWDSGGTPSVEIISAYELSEHPDYSFLLGDIVFRFPKQLENFEEASDSLEQCPSQHLNKDILARSLRFEGHGCNNLGYSSCIGNVIGLKDGEIEVKWANGIISTVAPCEIFGIDKNEVFASMPIFDEERNGGSVGKLMVEPDRQFGHEKEKDLLAKANNDSEEHCLKTLLVSSALSIPRSVIGFLVNMASNYFSFHDSSFMSSFVESRCYNSINGNCSSDMNPPTSESTEELSYVEESPYEKMVDMPSDSENLSLSRQPELAIDKKLKGKNYQFKNFDIVNDFSDHHFETGAGKKSILPQVQKSWLKRVRQEWSMLEENLPDNIFARAYEERIDLLRACIVGAAGTPYQDALFFFDIHLPPEYPHEPPLVHYRSNGLRLNPNLYESGNVCLSLLKTWTGTGTEVWKPDSSTVLQVLVSIQALVLNEKPYYNEAGYDNQIGRAEGDRNSAIYNENAFLLSRKSIIYHLHAPPKHFEALVEEHFTCRSHQILLSCKSYMDGKLVRCGNGSGGTDAANGNDGTSTGFKLMLGKLLPKLLEAFEAREIDCCNILADKTMADGMN